MIDAVDNLDFGGTEDGDSQVDLNLHLEDTDSINSFNPEVPDSFSGLEIQKESDRMSELESLSLEVESKFLSYLENGEHSKLNSLNKGYTLSNKLPDSLIHNYVKAISFNPALKWYPKFSSILGKQGFYVDGEVLNLCIGSKQFKKMISPFLSEFSSNRRGDSSIVDVVLSTAENIKDSNFQRKLKSSRSIKLRSFEEEDEYTPDVGSNMVDNPTNSVNYLDDGGLFGNPSIHPDDNEKAKSSNFLVSILDFSNSKIVSSYLSKKREPNINTFIHKLKMSGASDSRIGVILSLIKTGKNLKIKRKKSLSNNKTGLNDLTEFNYE